VQVVSIYINFIACSLQFLILLLFLLENQKMLLLSKTTSAHKISTAMAFEKLVLLENITDGLTRPVNNKGY